MAIRNSTLKGSNMKKLYALVFAAVSMLFSALAQAAAIVDYTAIMTSVSTELTLGITAAVAGIGIIWGARVGVRFVKSLLN